MKKRHTAFTWFEPRSESARNWLALGLLLAAWNFSDNEAVRNEATKPQGLQHHTLITARSLRAHE
jgi:hypothetical protein